MIVCQLLVFFVAIRALPHFAARLTLSFVVHVDLFCATGDAHSGIHSLVIMIYG